jgi:hypothetical protein
MFLPTSEFANRFCDKDNPYLQLMSGNGCGMSSTSFSLLSMRNRFRDEFPVITFVRRPPLSHPKQQFSKTLNHNFQASLLTKACGARRL